MNPNTHTTPFFVTHPDNLGIVAASSGIGQSKYGVETAPKVLMSGPLPSLLRRTLGLKLFGDARYTDCGSLHSSRDYGINGAEKAKFISDINQKVSRWVYEHAMAGRMVLTLGGDHSIAIGSVSGMARAIHEKSCGQTKLGVIWMDAHAGINIPETSVTGNLHGMTLAFLSGLARPTASGSFMWMGDEQRVRLDKLVYIGLRDVDDAEKKFIQQHKIKFFTPFDITHLGIRAVMDEIFEYLGSGTPIHLSFDIDSLDPSVAPCTGMPAAGGLTLREGQYVAERLSRSGQLVAVDLVELNPELGSELDKIKTLDAAVSVLKYALGGTVV